MNWREFFEDDQTLRGSMNRLATFVAVVVLSIGFFCLILMCIGDTAIDLQQKLGALTTIGIILAGLGGFNYAAGRAAGAYTQVRVAQAEQGLQPTPPPQTNPSMIVQVGPNGQSSSDRVRDVDIKAEGEVNVSKS